MKNKQELIKILKDLYDSGKHNLDRDRAEFETYAKIITLFEVLEKKKGGV